MTHKELIPIAYKWVLKNASCGIAFKEFHTTNMEIPDVLGFNSWSSVLIECKASRADFKKDFKKPFRLSGKGMGQYRFYMCPTGLIKKEELPEKWGLIYVSEKGKATCVVNPIKERGKYLAEERRWEFDNSFERDLKGENAFMYSALRRMHLKGHLEEIYDKNYIYS
jgi:hypothetical protein